MLEFIEVCIIFPGGEYSTCYQKIQDGVVTGYVDSNNQDIDLPNLREERVVNPQYLSALPLP